MVGLGYPGDLTKGEKEGLVGGKSQVYYRRGKRNTL
jgi:hypothetical protein